MAEIALVRKAAARAEEPLHVLVCDHKVGRGRLLHDRRVQSDGERLPAAHVGLVLWQQHGQLGELEGERHLGADDALGVVAQVVLAEEAGGHIDGHDGGVGLVDVAHHGGVSARKRSVEARSEEAVDHHVVFGERGRLKVVDHLVEAHLLVGQDALLVLLTVGREALAGVEEVDLCAIRLLGQ